jgi:radical SAM superfamily enzyme YgiQ (UPF0313 family)
MNQTIEKISIKELTPNSEHKILNKLSGLNKKVHTILLIQPLQIHESKLDLKIARNKRYYMYPPYGLGILNTILKKKKFNSKILDLNFEVFNYIKNNINITSLNISNFWKDQLTNKLNEIQPDLVGVSCTFTMNHLSMIEIFKVVKNFNKKIICVAGGVHVSNATEMVLRDSKDIDFANTYEAENSFIEFINYINKLTSYDKISQISYLLNDKIEKIEKRDVPEHSALNIIPDFDNIDLSKLTDIGEIGTFRYWRPKDSKGSAVLSNKGCRARCSFCSVRNFNGKGVRAKSVETVLDEIESLKNNYGINHITWLDDDLFYDTKRTLELFDGIIKRNLKITWDASNGLIASAAVAHPELIDAAEKSGCIGAYFGIESGNDQILKNIFKPSGVKHYKKLGPLMRKHPKIFTRGFLIIGFPGETLGQIHDTISVSTEMGLDWYTVQLLTPLPSTEIYDQMVESGKAKKNDLNLEGEGFTMFSVRESERQRKQEESNKRNNKDFINLLNSKSDHIPTQAELNDLWFLTDYEINYKPILKMDDVWRLKKLEAFLTDVSDRMTRDNPLSNYFLSIVLKKIKKIEESKKRINLVKKYLEKSEHWQQRFKAINLNL